MAFAAIVAWSAAASAQPVTIVDGTAAGPTSDGVLSAGEYYGVAPGQGTGFGGKIGAGINLFVESNAAGDVTFALTEPAGGVGAAPNDNNCNLQSPDTVVIYVDSQPGGFTSTADFTDIGDRGRAAVSGRGTDNSQAPLTFPAGFEADFALVFSGNDGGGGNGGASLFALNADGAHTFVKSLGLAPAIGGGFGTACDREIGGITMADLGGVPGGAFRFFGTLLNATNGYRSNELIGVAAAVVPAANPGNTSVDLSASAAARMVTYLAPLKAYGFDGFAGGGFAPSPSATQLDSDEWIASGENMTPALAFGGTSATSGVYAQGSNITGTSGGVYGFTVGTGNAGLCARPSAGTFSPGNFVLRVTNTTSTAITGVAVGYDFLTRNDQGRSSTFNAAYSLDNSSYTALPELAIATETTAAGSPTFVRLNPTGAQKTAFAVTGLSIAPGGFFYVRWTSDDNVATPGTGSWDASCLDNVFVRPIAVPIPVTYDWGDAPGSFPTTNAQNGARHPIGALFLGAAVDAESDGQPNADATGDGADDDGIAFTSPITPGEAATIEATATGDGFLSCWLDLDHNGAWEAADRVLNDVAVTVGVNELVFPVPADALGGPTFARCRLDAVGGVLTTGEGSEGEVEDYRVVIDSYDYGDAPLSYGVARHTLVGSPRLGALVDREAATQDTADASGDGADDDGVTFPATVDPTAADALFLVADLEAGTDSSTPTALTPALGALYFIAQTTVNGKELYAYDGATTTLHELNPSGNGATGGALGAVGGRVVFFGTNGTTAGLWAFDGATFTSVDATLTAATNFYTDGATAYFIGTTADEGAELWSTDGVTASRLTDIAAGPTSSLLTNASFPRPAFGQIVFSALSGGSAALYHTDGSVVAATSGTTPAFGTMVGDVFAYVSAVAGTPLYRWDGTAAPAPVCPEVSVKSRYDHQFTVYRGALYFSGAPTSGGTEQNVWRFDGTACEQVFSLADDQLATPEALFVANGRLYLVATNHVSTKYVYAYDGQTVTAMTRPSGAFAASSLALYGGHVFLSATVPTTTGTELYRLAQSVGVTTSGGGTLSAWVDTDHDGQFGAGERVLTDVAMTANTMSLALDLPADAVPGPTIARFRLSKSAGLAASGDADDGEVEDYQVLVAGCGDGVRQAGEACDDGDTSGGDGCAADCQLVEPGFACPDAGGPCDCAAGRAGADCAITCAGGAATPCNLHGTCSEGTAGDGTCTSCDPGWWGAACDQAGTCGDVCLQDVLVQATGACANVPTSGNACDDGNACTVDDTCGGGTCSGSLPGEADTVYATIDLSAAAPAPASTPAPHGVVLDADGNLYVSDLANDRIDVYDPAGSWLRGWGGYGTADGQLYDPRDLAIDRDNGLLFVADYGNNRVDVFTLEGAFVRKFTTGNLPRGIDFHDGLVYVGEQLGKRVSVWQPDGTFVRAIGSGPDSVYGVAVADNGDVYAVYGFYTLRWYSPTGVLLGTVGSQGTDPGQFDNHDGLTFDRGGNLWVVDRSNKRLQRLSADLQPGGIFAAGQLQDAFNLAVDDAGRVYVADASAHAIEIFWEPLGCSDGLDCTVLDTCVAGACADVTPRDCSDGDQCTADLCNPAGGACENPLRTYASSQLTEFATGGTTAALAVSGSHVYFGKTDQIRRKTLAGGGSANFSEGSMDPTAMVIGPGGVVYSLQSDGVYRYALTGPNLLGSFGSGGQ
ncbi:MAG: hypothetical protein KC635_02400, partial [Myxococcales bacterium]|nr:hypothetical protein [Myxococcales bacterium]